MISKSRIVTHAVTVTTGSCINKDGSTVLSSAMIRTLYRDFIHIIKVQQKQQQQQQKQSTTHAKKKKQQPNDPMQQLRDEFRATTSTTSATNNTIESRYQYGINRFAFLRMNTIQYRPRPTNHHNVTTTTTNGTSSKMDHSSSSVGSNTGTERFIYKNGQRYNLNSLRDETVTIRTDKGYTISPYTGKNLDPQSVTRHRQNLKRAGFMNNSHAKGMF